MARKRSKAPPADVADPDLLRVLMDYLPDAIYFKDRESRFIRINKGLAAWYGLKDPAKAVGKTDADYFTPEFARAIADVEREIMKTGVPCIDVEEKIVWPNGHVSWALATKMPLRDKRGRIIGTFGISRDISKYKQQEEAVRNSEMLYRSLADNLPQNFFRKDLEGRVVFANRRFCTTIGRTLKEILGKTDMELHPAELARKYREDDARVIQTGRSYETVESHKPRGKETLYVRVVKTPVYDGDGRVVGVQGIFWEVSEPK